MRFTVDELVTGADKEYEPVELELRSGKVARFENLIRLNEDRQKAVLEMLDDVRQKAKEKAAEKGEDTPDEDAPLDITQALSSIRDQVKFTKTWVDLMLDDDIAAEVHETFNDDIGLYLYVFNTWMGREGEKGEASPSAS